MTKKMILAVALVLCVFAGRAGAPLSPVKFGVNAGLSYQNIDLGNAQAGYYGLKAESDVGYYGGMSMRVTLPAFYIQPEINYMHNSYELTATSTAGSSSSTVKLNSLEVPVLVGVRALRFFRLQAGPVFNLMNETSVSAARSNTEGVVAPAHSVTYTRPSVGYMVGLSLDLANVVSLSARYNGEFSKPEQSITIGDQTSVVSTRVRTWVISAGFHF